MSRHEDREAEGYYCVRVFDAETGRLIEQHADKTWRSHCLRVSVLRDRYDTPDAYRIEVDQ